MKEAAAVKIVPFYFVETSRKKGRVGGCVAKASAPRSAIVFMTLNLGFPLHSGHSLLPFVGAISMYILLTPNALHVLAAPSRKIRQKVSS